MIALSELTCEQATQILSISEDNYQRISDLIFDTDPFIYPALFGNGCLGKSNARLLLPSVFESNLDRMFSKRNLFIAYLNEAVVGIILWHKGSLEWNSSTLINCAKENNVQLIENNVVAVQSEYVESRYNQNENDQDEALSIINVCVAKDYRGLGIAHHMLSSFIDEHKCEEMELTVLADNSSAIALYRGLGFETSKTTDGFSLSADKPKCQIMIRDRFVVERQPNKDKKAGR